MSHFTNSGSDEDTSPLLAKLVATEGLQPGAIPYRNTATNLSIGIDSDSTTIFYNGPSTTLNDDDNEEEEYLVVREEYMPTGTIFSSCLNIVNTILGAGMLALPSAVAASGLGVGIVMITVCASLSSFGLFLLTRIAAQVGRKSSFFTCASITFPQAAVYFDLAISIKCFGVSVSYLVIIGRLAPEIVKGYWPDATNTIWMNRETWITISMLILVPFCFLRRLDSLRYTSAFSLVAVLYLLFVVLRFYIFPLDSISYPKFKDLEWVNIDTNFLKHLPIFVFSFTCHQNIFSIHNELANNSSAELDKVIGRSIGTSYFVYLLIGIIGYLTFGKNVTSNIIGQYPPGRLVQSVQVAIIFLVLFSYPLQCHPCRNSLHSIVPLKETLRGSPMSKSRFSALTVAIMIFSYLVAVSVSDLSTVLSVVGATGSTTICYILPGLFYYKLCEIQRLATPGSKRPVIQILSIGMIFIGILVMIIGLTNIFFL